MSKVMSKTVKSVLQRFSITKNLVIFVRAALRAALTKITVTYAIENCCKLVPPSLNFTEWGFVLRWDKKDDGAVRCRLFCPTLSWCPQNELN
jgi:hypothetical protein